MFKIIFIIKKIYWDEHEKIVRREDGKFQAQVAEHNCIVY